MCCITLPNETAVKLITVQVFLSWKWEKMLLQQNLSIEFVVSLQDNANDIIPQESKAVLGLVLLLGWLIKHLYSWILAGQKSAAL